MFTLPAFLIDGYYQCSWLFLLPSNPPSSLSISLSAFLISAVKFSAFQYPVDLASHIPFWPLLLASLVIGTSSALLYLTKPWRVDIPVKSYSRPQQCFLFSIFIGWLELTSLYIDWVAFTKADRPKEANRQLYKTVRILFVGVLTRIFSPSL